MAGFDKSGSYDFKTLEGKYGKFMAPAFTITVDGSYKIDSAKVPVSALTVQQTTLGKAGACTFTVEGMYDYENGKWTDGFLDKIDVGMDVEVEAGYAESKKRIFYGFVEDFNIEFSSEAAPRLNVTAMDGMSLLMNNSEEQDFGDKTTKDVVADVIEMCLNEGVIEGYEIDDLPAFEGKFVKDKKSSDYNFLKKVAEMCFMSFCVIDGQMLFKKLLDNTKSLITLQMGVSLISFSKKLGFGSGSTGSVTVISNGTKDKKEVRGVADSPSPYGSGETAAEKWKALGGANKDVCMNFLKTAEECETVAQNMLDSLCLGFVSGSGRCLGIPELSPGRYITIKGLDNKTNGDYYVTDVTHNYTGDGYFTTFEVKGFRSK